MCCTRGTGGIAGTAEMKMEGGKCEEDKTAPTFFRLFLAHSVRALVYLQLYPVSLSG